MTFSADAGSYDIHQYVIERFQYTGHDANSPIGATVATTNSCSGAGVDCPVTITLSAAPASSSQVLAFASINGGCYSCNPAPGSGWTEIHDLVNASESWGEYQSQVRTGSTSTSVSWADLNSGNTNPDGAVLGALEIRAGSGGGGGSLTRTDFGATSDLNGVGTGTFSTASFTPANSSLQMVTVHASAESDETLQGSNLTLANSAGLTCTLRLTSLDPPANTWGHGFRVWTCPVTTGTSMTFSADAGSYNIHQYVIERFEFTGYDANSPIGATVTATDSCSHPNTNCPVTITLSAAPASSSQVLAFASINGGCNSGSTCNPAPGSGWTEIHDLVNAAESWGEYQSQARTGSTSASVSWSNLNSGNGSPDGAVLGALEIRANPGGGGDTVSPVITITAPQNNAFTSNAATVITGSISEPATLTINGQSVPTPSNNFYYTTSLQQGANSFTLIAIDAANNSSQQGLAINLDTAAPATPVPTLISVGAPISGQVTVSGQPGAVEPNAAVRVRNAVTGATVVGTALADGSFSIAVNAGASDLLLIEVVDAAANVSQAIGFGNGGETTYGYDDLGRLRIVRSPNGSDQRTTTYTYDAAGNRDTVVVTVD